MTILSVNINKLATLRNARGHNNPNVQEWALRIQNWGVKSITVHPRPDERHIRKQDVYLLKEALDVEFNIEGYPSDDFCKMVLDVRPDQVTLVPDDPEQITSNHGWNTMKYQSELTKVVAKFNDAGIRTSLFLDPNPDLVSSAASTGASRIELYTEIYAKAFERDTAHKVIRGYAETARRAAELNMGVNAGHDLDLNNLQNFLNQVPNVQEVSIGHALICDALELGMEETVKRYLMITEG